MIADQGSPLALVGPEDDDRPAARPSTPSDTGAGGVLDVVPADEFEAHIRMGRARGGLTQDDVITLLRSVELDADLISDVVQRIRDAGIEFVYDTGETTIVPMTGPVADELSDHRREEFPVLPDSADVAVPTDVLPSARIVALEPSWSPARPSTSGAGGGRVWRG